MSHSEPSFWDTLSARHVIRKVHPVWSVQTGSRFPLGQPLGKCIPDWQDATRQCVVQQSLQVYFVEPCRQRGLSDACRLQLFGEHSCRADFVHGKSQQGMAVERQVRLALSFGNERLGSGAPGQHGLVGVFDEPVELAQRELSRLALPGKVRSYGLGRIEGVRKLVLKSVGRKTGLDHDGSGDRFPAALGADVGISKRYEGRTNRATIAGGRSLLDGLHQLLSRKTEP